MDLCFMKTLEEVEELREGLCMRVAHTRCVLLFFDAFF